jgi:hypothetical protein
VIREGSVDDHNIDNWSCSISSALRNVNSFHIHVEGAPEIITDIHKHKLSLTAECRLCYAINLLFIVVSVCSPKTDLEGLLQKKFKTQKIIYLIERFLFDFACSMHALARMRTRRTDKIAEFVMY